MQKSEDNKNAKALRRSLRCNSTYNSGQAYSQVYDVTLLQRTCFTSWRQLPYNNVFISFCNTMYTV